MGFADPCRLHRLKEAGESGGAIGGACATPLGRLRRFASNDHGSPEWLMLRDILLTPLFSRAVYVMRCRRISCLVVWNPTLNPKVK